MRARTRGDQNAQLRAGFDDLVYSECAYNDLVLLCFWSGQVLELEAVAGKDKLKQLRVCVKCQKSPVGMATEAYQR